MEMDQLPKRCLTNILPMIQNIWTLNITTGEGDLVQAADFMIIVVKA